MNDKYATGDVVSVRFGGVLRHYGVVTSGGRIISNSRADGGVVSQTLAEFAKGRRVSNHGPYSSHHPAAVETRARAALGRDYDLAGSNCIHFVRQAHRREHTVVQIGLGMLKTLGDMLGAPKRRY